MPAWRWVKAGLALALLAGTSTAAPGGSPPSAEYQIKAVFLFNFAQFVEWPAQAFSTARSPLVIGVLGEDPFGSYLDEMVQSEKIGERPLTIRRFQSVDEITECHILFVSHSFATQFDKIALQLEGHHLLTVGDVDNFNRNGGIVRFATEKGKIRLRINMEAARDSDLTISSKLLRWATLVTAEKG